MGLNSDGEFIEHNLNDKTETELKLKIPNCSSRNLNTQQYCVLRIHLLIVTPLRSQVTLESCAKPVKSLEIQLVRVETCGCAEGYAKDGELSSLAQSCIASTVLMVVVVA